MWSKILPVTIAVLLSAGCLFEPYRPTTKFDLEPQSVSSVVAYRAMEFRNDSISGVRFALRGQGGVIETPHNERWVADPGVLVASALNRSLGSDRMTSPVGFTGSIEVFEADLERGLFRFAGFLKFDDKSVERFDLEAPLSGNTAGDIVSSASLTVNMLAQRIAAGRSRATTLNSIPPDGDKVK